MRIIDDLFYFGRLQKYGYFPVINVWIPVLCGNRTNWVQNRLLELLKIREKLVNVDLSLKTNILTLSGLDIYLLVCNFRQNKCDFITANMNITPKSKSGNLHSVYIFRRHNLC